MEAQRGWGFGCHQPCGSYSDLLLRGLRKNRCPDPTTGKRNLSEAGAWESVFSFLFILFRKISSELTSAANAPLFAEEDWP